MATLIRFPGRSRPQPLGADPTVVVTPAPAQPASTTTGTTGTTGSSWSNPSRWTPTHTGPLDCGSVIKDRFILEEQIGIGGMGTVYRARDLRKVEAQDRNPYVAIKVLNSDLKQYPQAMQALQREARKAQQIAHPNIVTVYDFDRDGTDVYMVMELLDGNPLDRVIKRVEGVGLPVEEALKITSDMCRAMAHAHAQGIVHADFKPSNIFLTCPGVVKILDFGIARAAKRSDQPDGAVTLFDPGSLGALTPAYASCEVIEGLEPTVKDDIYAMACVVYQLLTGTHPFQKMSAAGARKEKLVALRPAGLSRRQWQTLRRALEFRRENRPESAMAFLEGLLPRRHSQGRYVAVAAASAMVTVAALFSAHALVPQLRTLSGAQIAKAIEAHLNAGPRTALASLPLAIPAAERPPVVLASSVAAVVPPAEVVAPASSAHATAALRIGVPAQGANTTATVASIAVPAPADSPATASQRIRAAAQVTTLATTQAPTLATNLATNQASNVVASSEKIPPRAAEPEPAEQSASLEQKLLAQAQANDVSGALATLRSLRASGSANEAFLANEAPQAIGQAYLRLASAAAKAGRIEEALSLTALGSQTAASLPVSRQLDDARQRYARYCEIDDQLKYRDRIFVHHIRWKISRVATQAPEEMVAVKQRWERDLATRIHSTDDAALAGRLSRLSQALFKNEPSPDDEAGGMTADSSIATPDKLTALKH